MTSDEIHVVKFTFGPDRGLFDLDSPPEPNERADDLGVKVYARYFNDRFQTYDRRVHFWGHSYSGGSETPQRIRAAMDTIEQKLRPFAVIPPAEGDSAIYAEEAAKRGIVAVSYQSMEREFFQSVAPLAYSYAPDTEDVAANAGSYLCSRIIGRQAIHSGNPSDVGRVRRLGLLYANSPNQPSHRLLAEAVKSELLKQCSFTFAEEASVQSSNTDSAAALGKLRGADVTTIVWIAGPDLATMNTAAAQAWFPEWFTPRQIGGFDDGDQGSSNQAEMAHTFSVSFDYRRDALERQPWHQAFREGCPSCTVPATYFTPRTYSSFLLLYYGIQAAGPRLTPATLDKGLHAIPARASTSPYVPAVYFSPGNFTWVKDSKEMWWDPAGTAPGARRAGCWRLPREGRRYRLGEWPKEQIRFDSSTDPCQGPPQVS